MHKKRYILGIYTLIVLVLFTGCSALEIDKSQEKDVYSTQYAQSPMEYMIFLDKEIAPITNALTTEILLSRHYEQGTATKENALESAESSLNIIKEGIHNVDIMQPPALYAEVRESVLNAMDQCKADMEEYIAVLKGERSTELTGLRSSMQVDFLLITGDFNVYTE